MKPHPDKKKHHYVPVSYLSRFTDENGFIHCSRKPAPDNPIRIKPDEIAFRRYYYSQPLPWGGLDHNQLENGLAELDGLWDKIVEPLLTKAPSNHIVGELIAFIGLQRVRVPAFRSAIEHALARCAKRNFDELKAAGEIKSPENFPDLADKVTFKIDPHQSIHAMPGLMRSMGDLIGVLGFSIAHNETDIDLITSDNPVIFYSLRGNLRNLVPYPVDAKSVTELLFPISPKALIVGRPADHERYAKKGLKHSSIKSVDEVRRINTLIARFSYEAIFSRAALKPAFVLAHSDLSPVLDPDFEGFDPEGIRVPPFVFGERTALPKWDRKRDYRIRLPGLS